VKALLTQKRGSRRAGQSTSYYHNIVVSWGSNCLQGQSTLRDPSENR
jgi:hypothetical protein